VKPITTELTKKDALQIYYRACIDYVLEKLDLLSDDERYLFEGIISELKNEAEQIGTCK
jgi:hypothetical protein